MEASSKNRNPVVHSDPEILGGTPVFVGTRVPLRNLIDYLEGGHSLNEFSFARSSNRRARGRSRIALENFRARRS
jgi:hypothetical protein